MQNKHNDNIGDDAVQPIGRKRERCPSLFGLNYKTLLMTFYSVMYRRWQMVKFV